MHKISIGILIVTMLARAGRVQATIVEFGQDLTTEGGCGDEKAPVCTDRWVLSAVWTSGHHIILDGDWYGEI